MEEAQASTAKATHEVEVLVESLPGELEIVVNQAVTNFKASEAFSDAANGILEEKIVKCFDKLTTQLKEVDTAFPLDRVPEYLAWKAKEEAAVQPAS